jgi:copper chaperone
MQTEHIQVSGMTCGGCTNNVTRALKALPGVGDVNVSLAAGEATVQYDERLTSSDKLKSAVQTAGYGVGVVKVAQSRPAKGGCCG